MELVAHWNRPEVRRYLFDDGEVSAGLASMLLRDSDADFAHYGYGLWKAYLGAELIGMCGLRRHEDGRVEIIYSLDPEHRGAGLATEAARTVLAWGRRVGLTEILVETDEGNLASQRLAQRLGAVAEQAEGGLRRYVVPLGED